MYILVIQIFVKILYTATNYFLECTDSEVCNANNICDKSDGSCACLRSGTSDTGVCEQHANAPSKWKLRIAEILN